MGEKNAYILSTNDQELFRLGVQHQVWASEAQKGWEIAGISAGQTVLDLGCGPGFCSKELAFLVGNTGRVLAVDQSQRYLDYLQKVAEHHHLNLETIAKSFDEMELQSESLDAVYCRWALAWIPNPEEVLQKVYKALKPGGKVVLHEYYNWMTHQVSPALPGITKAIGQAFKSFQDSPGNINIGKELPKTLNKIGMKNIRTRPMIKLAQPNDATWQWPSTFYEVYFPILKQNGYLSQDELLEAFRDLKQLEQTPGASLCCPFMVEVIAEK